MLQGLGEGKVAASSFRTSYVPLNQQADFINGMQVSMSTVSCVALHPVPYAWGIKESLGVDVYSFSLFQVI